MPRFSFFFLMLLLVSSVYALDSNTTLQMNIDVGCNLKPSDLSESAYGIPVSYGPESYVMRDLGYGNFTGHTCTLDNGFYLYAARLANDNAKVDDRWSVNTTSNGTYVGYQGNGSNYLMFYTQNAMLWTNNTVVTFDVGSPAYTGGGPLAMNSFLYYHGAPVGKLVCGAPGNGPQPHIKFTCQNTTWTSSKKVDAFTYSHVAQALGGLGAWDLYHNVTISNYTASIDTNSVPSCSLTYPQDTFYASNSTQYFNYTFTVTDPDNDQLYYSEGERTDTGRYIVDELNFNTFDICSSPRISSPGHNLSCATDMVTATLVTSHLLMPAVTIAQVDLTHYLFLTAGASFRYTLEKPLIQDGSIAFGMALQNGNVVNVTLVNGIGQEVYSLLFNQTNDWLNISNGTAIVISESSTHYSPEHKDNWVNVLISTYPNSSKIRTSVDTRQDAGKVWQTTNAASLYSVQWSTPADQNPWFWMMIFAKFSGYEYDPGLAFTTTPPNGQRILDWTGGKWLTFYGSDAYHQPTEFCQKDVYVTVLNTNNPLGTSTFGLDNTTPASPYDALAGAQGAASIYTAIPGSLVLLQGAWALLYFFLFMYFWYCSGFKDFFTSILIASVIELAWAVVMQLGTNLILTASVLLAFGMIPQFTALFMPGTANKNSGRGGMH